MTLKRKTLAAKQFVRSKEYMMLVLMGHNNKSMQGIYFAIKVSEDTCKFYFLDS